MFYRQTLTRPFTHIHLQTDCGCVQHDALSVDLSATYAACIQLEQDRDAILQRLAQQFTRDGTQLVVSDIAALPLAAAEQLGLPSLAISNFTWHDIYRGYLPRAPEFDKVLHWLARDYGSATRYARLSPAVSGAQLMPTVDVGMLCREDVLQTRAELARALSLNPNKYWCLIYTGRYGMPHVPWQQLAAYTDWQFVGLYPLSGAPRNFRCILEADNVDYTSLTAASDLVLGKLGYGLVTECLYQGTPVAYPDRRDFCEHSVLAQALQENGSGFELDDDVLATCDLQAALDWSTAVEPHRRKSHAGDALLALITDVLQGARRAD